jgi:hypothetical protein
MIATTLAASPIEALLGDSRLLPAARAVLLLRVCVLAQVLRPEVAQRHWSELKALAHHLPPASREAFDGLKASLEPPPPSSLGGFAREIAEAVEAARRPGNREATLQALAACEQRILARWWPFGKGPAWDAVARAWIETDRVQGLAHLGHLARPVQTNLLIRANDRSPFGWREWDAASREAGAATRAAVEELLERDSPHLDLSGELAEEVGEELLKAVYEGSPDDREAEGKRDKARARYTKLVQALLGPTPDVAERLLERLFDATAGTAFYAERWVSRFFALFRLVAQWRGLPALAPRGEAYVAAKSPKHLKDAVLAHWSGLGVRTAEEADAAWAQLEPRLADVAPAEHWFLLTVLRQGLPEHAVGMASRSPRAGTLLPALQRAWLFEHPESARGAVAPSEAAGDLISEFLLRDPDGRVAFLREHTESGQRALPTAMWKPPDLMDLLGQLDDTAAATRGVAIGSWYKKTEPKESQFGVFVRINGYGQHLYENLDPILLAAMVAWDEAHPAEVASVTRQMWDAVQPKVKANVRFDLLRNDLLDRCESVLPAHPETYSTFYHWVLKELVEQAVTEHQGNMIYTFRLNERAPFLYALLGAQKVARVSARRCDQILSDAIGTLPTNADLMTAAAQLYAADKGLAGLEPPNSLRDRSLLAAWQLGVAQTALKDVLAMLAEDQPAPA